MKNKDEIVGMILLRGQGLHYGHTSLFFKAMMECDKVIVMYGSSNKPLSFTDPFNVGQRMKMSKMTFGNDQKKIKYISLADINAVTKEEWCDYVFDTIEKTGMPQPDKYYAGDLANSTWFKNVKNKHTGKAMEIVIVDRLKTNIMSGTDIRNHIVEGLDEWKSHVPPVIHEFIETNFPLILKQEFKEVMDSFSKEIKENYYKKLKRIHNYKYDKMEEFIDLLNIQSNIYYKLNNVDIKKELEKINYDYKSLHDQKIKRIKGISLESESIEDFMDYQFIYKNINKLIDKTLNVRIGDINYS